ncbi:MAG: DUF5618 family protein [Leadbetterella sp.]|nr:DUF5618 family protein [Leadbetterella sp.]
MTIHTHPIEEARRYLDNARTILSERARKDGDLYQDKKYVRMAGNTMYNGVLVALDGLLGAKKKGRKDVDWYRTGIHALDKKALDRFNALYETLHLTLGYDGNTIVSISREALKRSYELVDWVAIRLERP